MEQRELARKLEDGSLSTQQHVHIKLYDNDYKLFYTLYKLDWKDAHGITVNDERRCVIAWYDGHNGSSLCWGEHWYANAILEYGFGDKGCYASYFEFCMNEFLDEDYMKHLINGDAELQKKYDEMMSKLRSW